MKDMKSEIKHRELCQQRDREFLELYHPTLDTLVEQGMPMSKARRAAVEFTIANGHPHYHVDHDRAYRCVCHLLNAEQKKAVEDMGKKLDEKCYKGKSRFKDMIKELFS